MATPKLENGFTRIANELLEALSCIQISGGQFNIIMAVIRLTYGYHCVEKDMSQTYLAKMTGRNKSKVAKDILQLMKKRILHEVKSPTFNQSRILSINKNYEEWEGYVKETVGVNAEAIVVVNAETTVGGSTHQYKERSKERKKANNSIKVLEDGKCQEERATYNNSSIVVVQDFKDELANLYPHMNIKEQIAKMEKRLFDHPLGSRSITKYIIDWFANDWSNRRVNKKVPQAPKQNIISPTSKPWQNAP